MNVDSSGVLQLRMFRIKIMMLSTGIRDLIPQDTINLFLEGYHLITIVLGNSNPCTRIKNHDLVAMRV